MQLPRILHLRSYIIEAHAPIYFYEIGSFDNFVSSNFMPKTRDVFTKVCQLCKVRGFVFERSFSLPGENIFSGIDYGPLGIEIKRNFFQEWWREIVTSRENVYGLDLVRPAVNNLIIQSEELNKLNNSRYQYLGEYLADTYHYACELFQNEETYQTQNPIGLAQSLTILQSDNATINEFMFRYVWCSTRL